MIIGYVRVSTVEQNEARQLVTMEKYNVTRVFTDKASAKDTKRPQLEKMLGFVDNYVEFQGELAEDQRHPLTIVIHDFSRLARSTKDLLEIVEDLTAKGVVLISAKENIDTSTPTGKLMLTMIGAINEFERSNMLERQREGIAIAKAEGKYKGRKEVKVNNFDEAYKRYLNRELTKSTLAKELDVSRPTLDKLIKAHESKATLKEFVSEDDLKKYDKDKHKNK